MNRHIKEENAIPARNSGTVEQKDFITEENLSVDVDRDLKEKTGTTGVEENNRFDYDLEGESLW